MKKFSLLVLMAFAAMSVNAQEVITDAHASNHRSWSIGLNVGPTISTGDALSFSPDKEAGIPSGVGGFEIGVRGHLTKFFNPTIGLQGSAGYHSTSGTNRGFYFEGNYFDGDLSLLFNLSNWVMRGKVWDRKGALLFGVGIGAASIDAIGYNLNGDTVANVGEVDFAGRPKGGNNNRAFQATIPVQLQYKYRLSNALDLDLGFKYTFMTQDWPDAFIKGTTTDAFAYANVGLTYNFGSKDKKSVVYINPLDKMYADMEEVKNNFDQLTTDDDKDGVNNYFDKDNSTPEGVAVNGNGEATDVDMDGVPDYMDEDPFTGKGAKVSANGRAVDSDGDGVPDHIDEEPNTPKGTMVNFKGKTISGAGGMGGGYMPSVYFAFNSANVSAANYERLATVAMVMKNNPGVKVKIVGHADSRGSEEYNKNLSMRRAKAVVEVLVKTYGIDEGRFTTVADGEAQPLATGRYDVNRRADIMPQ